MMEDLYNAIDRVQDKESKNALMEIAKILQKVYDVRPVSTDTEQIAHAINTITGKI